MYDVNFIVLFETVSRFGSLFADSLPIRRMLPAGEQHRRPALLTQIQWVATAAGHILPCGSQRAKQPSALLHAISIGPLGGLVCFL